jgi:hypothetical protein
LVVHGADGRVVLDLELTDKGPRLTFESAELELRASRRVAIAAEEVAIEAERMLSLSSAGGLRICVAGDRHTRVEGEDRTEAAAVAIQANEGAVAVRAMQRVSIDGEHIGLNDDPCPQPFAWSKLADGGHDRG